MVSDLPWEESQFGPGSWIGKYVLEEQVGHGGMAVVYRARDNQLGRLVAVKIMASAVASDPEFRQRFVRESRAAAAVDDPHIIPVYEAGESAGVLFIAMRYVGGGDVRSLLARVGPLAVDRAAGILMSVGSALDAAHAAALVHRDVKPGNMLMDVRKGRPDHVYLADFGLTKATSTAASLTSTGRFLGTADYAAPEQIAGRPVDGRADQYALACAAVEMLTGQPPFPLENVMDVLTAHQSEPPPPLSARRDGLPGELDAVLGRALAKSPSDRYRSCGDFTAAFQRASGVGWHEAVTGRTPRHGADSKTIDLARGPGGGLREPAATSHLPLQRPEHTEQIEVGRRRRGGGRLLVAAAVAVALAAGVVAVVTLAPLRRAPAAPAAGADHPARRTAVAPGWHTYDDPSGFSVSLPPSWSVSSTAVDQVTFTGTPSGFAVVVAWSTRPQADALTDWQEQSAEQEKDDPSYQEISIRQVSYRNYDAADWQFTDVYQGVRLRVIDRTFIVRTGQLAYAIELSGPTGQWPAEYASLWQPLLTSFRPAS